MLKSRVWKNEKLNYANQFLALSNFIRDIFCISQIRTMVLSLGFSSNTSLNIYAISRGLYLPIPLQTYFSFRGGYDEARREICTIYPARGVQGTLIVT